LEKGAVPEPEDWRTERVDQGPAESLVQGVEELGGVVAQLGNVIQLHLYQLL